MTACSNGSPFICITASLFIINGECFSSGMYVGVENIDGGSFLEEIVDGKQMQWKVRKSIRRLIKSIKGWKKAKMRTDDLTRSRKYEEIKPGWLFFLVFYKRNRFSDEEDAWKI